jgi:hypothetical protein
MCLVRELIVIGCAVSTDLSTAAAALFNRTAAETLRGN